MADGVKGERMLHRDEQLLTPFPYPHTHPKGQQGSEFTHPGRGGRQQEQHKSPGERGNSLVGWDQLLPLGVGSLIAPPDLWVLPAVKSKD